MKRLVNNLGRDYKYINTIWIFTTKQDETYLMAKVGSGKKGYIKTLKYLGKAVYKDEAVYKPLYR